MAEFTNIAGGRVIEEGVLAPAPISAPGLREGELAEERISVATQRQLMWRRFRKHRVALVAGVVVIFAYLVVHLRRLPRLCGPGSVRRATAR